MSEIINGDSFEEMEKLEEGSIDSIVTDPPYAFEGGFMGREWDEFDSPKEYQEWCKEWAEKAYKVLKPGGYLLAFSGTHSFHRLVCGIEDAGFKIKNTLMWLYLTGFPKYLNISKSLDYKAFQDWCEENDVELDNPKEVWKQEDEERLKEITEEYGEPYGIREIVGIDDVKGNIGYENEDYEYKEEERKITEPSSEMAKKFEDWGTRLKPAYEPIVMAQKSIDGSYVENTIKHGMGGLNLGDCRIGKDERFPSNVIVGEDVDDMLSEKPSRMFYTPKAKKKERQAGLKSVENDIVSLKPINLMRYLCRLVTPSDGVVLDPFAGACTTGCACEVEEFDYKMIELREKYANEVGPKRVKYWSNPSNWTKLKDHPNLPDLKTKKHEKQYKSLDEFGEI